MASVPPLFANALRYSPGDHVRTPFGSGTVRSLSDNNLHVEVELAFGATLFATRASLIPEFRMLECGEIPKAATVLFAAPESSSSSAVAGRTAHGTVQSFHIREQCYTVLATAASNDNDATSTTTHLLHKDALRLAPGTRVRTKLGLGVVDAYRDPSDSYVVKLDFGGVGYIMPQDVACVDLRLLERVPKPLSADAIFAEFDGRITHADAEALSAKAYATHRRVQQFCEQHADTISFLSTNAAYGDEYSRALSALFDPALGVATDRVKVAGVAELAKLQALAATAKQTLESELLGGKDASAFLAQAAKVLSQLKNTSEVQGLEQSLRARAAEEIALAKRRVAKADAASDSDAVADAAAAAAVPSQRLVLSEVLQMLEARVKAQQQRLASALSSNTGGLNGTVSAESLQLELFATLQHRESDFVRAQDTIAHLEQLASAKMGVPSLRAMDPSALLARAEALLPRVSAHAGTFVESTEKYFAQMQQSAQGQTLLRKAQQLVQAVDDPDAFCGHVTRAIADVKLESLAAWGSSLSQDRAARQAFVDQVKNHCLDFFLSVLPTIQVDTIAGVEDNIEYAIAHLDLSNFQVRKERVKVRMGTVADEELFTVRATHLTALLQGFDWTFAQRSFPYLNGGGLADAHLTGGAIALGFKAEKHVVDAATGELKPVLVLHSLEIEITQELKLTVQGSWFSAVYNVLASVFAELIREYIAKTMESKLLAHVTKLLRTLNAHMDEYWPLVFQLLDIRVEDLPSASPWRGAKALDLQPQQVECAFADRRAVPFAFARAVLNKHVVVSRVLEPPDAMSSSDLARVPVGASVLAINGLACNRLTLDEFRALVEQALPEPFTLRFSLAVEDAAPHRRQRVVPRAQRVAVTFKHDGPFGFRLRSRPLAPFGTIVVGFTEPPSGKPSAAQASGKIHAGHLLLRVNDVDLRFRTLAQTLQILQETTKRPATLHFAPSPDGVVTLRDWPPMLELELSDEEAADGRNYCVLAAFARVPSFAQRSHAVARNDVLVRVNGESMLAPTHAGFAAIMAALKRASDTQRPLHAVFLTREQYAAMRAHMAQTAATTSSERTSAAASSHSASTSVVGADSDDSVVLDVATAEAPPTLDSEAAFLATIAPRELVFPRAPLGILFGNLDDEAAYVRQFISSAGPAEKCGLLMLGQAVLQVCGTTVPTDATPAVIEQMIADVEQREKPPKAYTITVRDLDLERELMK